MFRPDFVGKELDAPDWAGELPGRAAAACPFPRSSAPSIIAHAAAGVPMAVVSKRLGHSNPAVTSGTYSHLLGGVGASAAEAAAALIPTGLDGRP